jgi:hypothetical protein
VALCIRKMETVAFAPVAINSLTLPVPISKKGGFLAMGFRRRGLPLISVVLAVCFFAPNLFGQTDQSNRADLTRQTLGNAGGGNESGIPATPNDADLGEQQILKREEAYQPFTIAVGLPLFYTSNAALSRSNEQSDLLFTPVAGIYYQPRLSRTLYAIFDVREQLFYYDRFDELNFGAFDTDAGLIYFIPSLENLVLRATFNYNRLTEKNTFHAFFENYDVILNAELPVRINRAQLLSFGTSAIISMNTEPELPRRNDYEAYVGYSVNVTRDLNINSVVRLVVRDYYHQHERVDLSEILALSATYRFNNIISASALSSFSANQSNQAVFDYKVVNAGGALALSIRF